MHCLLIGWVLMPEHLHAQQPGEARVGEFAWGPALVKPEVLFPTRRIRPAYGPAGLSCPPERVPSGHRRPQGTRVCASRLSAVKLRYYFLHRASVLRMDRLA
jgi:hypothetical protein